MSVNETLDVDPDIKWLTISSRALNNNTRKQHLSSVGCISEAFRNDMPYYHR